MAEQKIRLLIVEDEEAILRGLIDLFVFHGYDVEWAKDGKEGLKKALGERFDLVILDVMLPARNGFDVLRTLRGSGSASPVLMLTARSSWLSWPSSSRWPAVSSQ